MNSRRFAPRVSHLLLTLALMLGLLAAPPAQTNARSNPPPDDPARVTLYLPFIAGPPGPRVGGSRLCGQRTRRRPRRGRPAVERRRPPQPMAGWAIGDGTRWATFPLTATIILEPGQHLWCTAQAGAFYHSFGTLPACEWETDTDPAVPNLDRTVSFAESKRASIAAQRSRSYRRRARLWQGPARDDRLARGTGHPLHTRVGGDRRATVSPQAGSHHRSPAGHGYGRRLGRRPGRSCLGPRAYSSPAGRAGMPLRCCGRPRCNNTHTFPWQ